jgi:hypothetical protein
MTALKKCLLGTVAGFVATTGAEAANLPAKAPPVQYVKICTLYGDGFYFIPGTDTCIRVGGYARADLGWNVTGARTANYAGQGGAQDRTSLDLSTRGRANFGMDTRTQTQFGVVRAVGAVHFQNQDATESMNTSRAFVQWAGWTLGRIKSFQDTFSLNESWNLAQGQTNSDTGANGVQSVAYTFDLGKGVTFDVGADDRRTKQIANLSVASTLRLGAEATDSHATQTWPDLYGALHIDEPEGFFAISAGVHNVNASYYSGSGIKGSPFAGLTCAQPGTSLCGHPSDKVGSFVQVGGEYKLPGLGGDRIGAGFRYGVGASQFGGGSTLASPDLFDGNNSVAVGWITDGVFVNGSSIELTNTWSAQGGYEHRWLPNLGTTIFAGFSHISYNSQAKVYFSGALCGVANTGATTQTSFTVTGNNCNPDWSFLELGSKTTWRPIPGLAISGEVMYNQVYTAFSGNTGNLLANAPGARPTGAYALSDHAIWTAFFRIQRNYNAAGAGAE